MKTKEKTEPQPRLSLRSPYFHLTLGDVYTKTS